MANAKLQMDYLSSLLISYHDICTSQKEIPEEFRITDEEVRIYEQYATDKGIIKPNRPFRQSKLEFPQHKTLEELFASETDIPEKLKINLGGFQQKFTEDWQSLTSELEDTLADRQRLLDDTFAQIYRISQEMLGQDVSLSDQPTIFVLGGLDTGANGTENGKYCYISVRHLVASEEKFLRMVIHEYVGHKFAQAHKSIHNELFSKIIYEIDEGFVKLVSNKILERTLGRTVEYIPFDTQIGTPGYDEQISVSYNVFNRHWNEFDQGKPFVIWYSECLTKVKSKLKL